MSYANVKVIRKDHARDADAKTVFEGVLPWVPRVGDTVFYGKGDWDGVVKFVNWDVDTREVIVELEHLEG